VCSDCNWGFLAVSLIPLSGTHIHTSSPNDIQVYSSTAIVLLPEIFHQCTAWFFFFFENMNLIGLSFDGFFFCFIYLEQESCISSFTFTKNLSNPYTTNVMARRSSKRNITPEGLNYRILTRQKYRKPH